jgi:hypothetical protein
MATAIDVLTLAAAQIGVKEHPAGSNTVKYNTWYYGRAVAGSAYPWCMAFIQWLMHQTGVAVPVKTASCSALQTAARKAGSYVTSGYRPGDVLLFNFSGKSNPIHTGILEAVSGSTLITIEGNTGSGNDANGGAVMRRNRKSTQVVGAWRPNYEAAVKDGKEKKDMTKEEAKAILKSKAALSDATIIYLDSYRFGDSLIIKLAQAMQ